MTTPEATVQPTATAAPAAPAPVPAAPAAPGLTIEPPAPPPAPPAPGETPVTYAPTGDAGLDVALDFIGNLGLGPEHPAVKAAGDGDFSQLKVVLAGLGDKAKGFERYVNLAEKSVKEQRTKAEAKIAADTKAVVEVAGGEAEWAKLREWVRANADPDELVAVNAALKAGGMAAKAMVRELKGLYAKSDKATQDPANPLANATGAGSVASDALSPKDYQAAIADLARKGQMNSPEYDKLKARRAAYRG